MIKYINHYTMNTGDCVTFEAENVEKELYFVMQSKINEAKMYNDEFIDLIDGTKIKITIEPDKSYVCTLYTEIFGELQPILITAGCCNTNRAAEIYGLMKDMYKSFYSDEMKIIPTAPFILDLLLPYSAVCMEKFSWTGDFCKCLGWNIMSPESIR